MANFTVFRKTRNEINNIPIVDGQMLIETDQSPYNKIYLDIDNTRIHIGGANDVDDEVSATSKNPLQNKVITNNLNTITNNLNTITNNLNTTTDNLNTTTDNLNTITDNLNTITDNLNTITDNLNEKANSTNAVFYGSVNMGRVSGSVVGDDSVTLGKECIASGRSSHAEGLNTTASGQSSHAEGVDTTASGQSSHAEGVDTTASGQSSHAEGLNTTASGQSSHAEGYMTTASSDSSHAEGVRTTARGSNSHAEGLNTTAYDDNSHAEGIGTIALANQHAQGHWNNTSFATTNSNTGISKGTAFVIGNGTAQLDSSNAFRVTGEGVTYAKGAYNTSGADYAEYCEWEDDNLDEEIRYGYFVTDCGLSDGKTAKIRKATSKDYIYGIVSANPSVIGNSDECWCGQYEMDEWGNYIIEHHKETRVNEEGKEEEIEYDFYKVNPKYDATKQYTQREKRPEWDAIGMVGILTVRDDGTCVKGGFCCSNDEGIATSCERKQFDCFRVVDRINDNLIKVRIG